MQISKEFFPAPDFLIEHDISDTGWSAPVFHYHDLYEMYLLEDGNRKLYINDKVYETSHNHLYLIRPYTFHRSSGTEAFKGLCIHFSENFLDRYFSITAKKKFLNCFLDELILLDSSTANKIHELAKKSAKDENWRFVYLSQIFQLVNEFSRNTDNESSFIAYEQMSAVMEYVNQNFANIKSLKDVAKKFYFTPNYFGSLFKKQTGSTFTNYIKNLRVRFACYRLSSTDMPIEEISQEIGFESLNYFGRVFKSLMGCTPTEYRNENSNLSSV